MKKNASQAPILTAERYSCLVCVYQIDLLTMISVVDSRDMSR